MTRYFCISATLLDPLFHGRGEGDEPEWPPSPMRLFQALLAGSRAGCRERNWSDAKAEAFRWLQRRKPPQILAPEARLAAGYTFYVPNNDGDKEFERNSRLTAKVASPYRILNITDDASCPQALHYLWPIEEEEWPIARSHAELLCREAKHLLALGWGIDQAVGNGHVLADAEAANLQGRKWLPWGNHGSGGSTLRIPTEGTLENLEQVHVSFLGRIADGQYNPPLKLTHFDSVSYFPSITPPPRPYAVFELSEGIAFRNQEASVVAAMLRSLACRCAQEDTHEFPGGSKTYVAGHVTDKRGDTPPRFSYLPLPTIGHEHADGMIRRVAIAEPYGGDGSHAGWARQRLCNQTLQDEDGNERGVLLDLWRNSSKAMLERYVGEGKIWSSVTPVILPGFDDGKQLKSEKLLLQAIEQSGLEVGMVTDLAIRKAPFWVGSQHPQQYRRPHYLKHLPAWHARLNFQKPISGPIALGAGRHCGLGVFARMDDLR